MTNVAPPPGYANLLAVFHDRAQPACCSLLYFRQQLRRIGLWPVRSSVAGRLRPYALCNALTLCAVLAQTLTVTLHMLEPAESVIAFGDNLVVLLGIYLIVYKIFTYCWHTDALESIVLEMNAVHCRNLTSARSSAAVRRLQRQFFLAELGAIHVLGVLGGVLVLALCVTGKPLPLLCKYPYGLQDGGRHPHWRWPIHISQGLFLGYIVYAVLIIDALACAISSQTAVNLRLLGIRLRALGGGGGAAAERETTLWVELREIVHCHQQLIGLVDRTNDCLYWSYVLQMAASTFIMCLTAFEALLAKDQPLVAFKFQVYMFTALCQLFYWCFIGNLMYDDSLDLANAAFEVQRWFDQTPAFQRNLMFVIQRAQTPLLLQPRPIFGFNFATFAHILSTSYSYFALLRTMIE